MDYLFPLITVPYLVRVLGPERYGTVGFGQGFIALLALFVDYGFALSATRRVSVQRDDIALVSRTASTVWAAKALFATAGLVVLVIAARAVPRLGEITMVLLLLYGRVIGGVLSPLWLFQGFERMHLIAGINLLNGTLLTVCVFTLIHRPSDYVLLAGVQGGSALVTGIVAACAALSAFRLRPALPSRADLARMLREGFPLFVSTSCVSAYTAANSLILGLLASDRTVGYFVAAEKIVGAVRSLTAPIAQATYPRLSKLASESKERALYWSRHVLLVMGGTGGALCAGLLVGAPLITRILLGPQFEPSIAVMRLLAPLALLVGLSNVFGIQIMLPFGRDRAFTWILMSAGVVDLALALLLAPRWGAAGMAGSVLAAETFVTVAMAFYLLYSGLNPFTSTRDAAGPR
jgi:PST family polysaccharide transporter